MTDVVPLSRQPLWLRFLMRLLFVYLCLYLVPFPFSSWPVDLPTWNTYRFPIIKWFAGLFGETDLILRHTGSSDTLGNVYYALFNSLVSLLVNLIWLCFDRSGKHDDRLLRWGAFYFRFVVLFYAVNYGVIKVLPLQMGGVRTYTAVTAFGDMTPMGLAWMFIGSATHTYGWFTGVGELTVAALMVFRRTAPLGALAGLVVFGNVAIINFQYDVCVKLFSVTLVLCCLWVLAADGRRLAAFFTGANVPARSPLSSPPGRYTSLVLELLKLGFIAYVVVVQFQAGFERLASGKERPAGPFDGVWRVQSFAQNGMVRPLANTDQDMWEYVVVGTGSRGAKILRVSGHPTYVGLKIDQEQQTLLVRSILKPEQKPFPFRRRHFEEEPLIRGYYEMDVKQEPSDYCIDDAGRLVFDVVLDGQATRLWLEKVDRRFLVKAQSVGFGDHLPLLVH